LTRKRCCKMALSRFQIHWKNRRFCCVCASYK